MALEGLSPGHLVGDGGNAAGTVSAATAAGSPVDGPYITYSSNASLTAEKILTAGSSVTIVTDGTAVYINALTGGGTGDITSVGDVASGAAFDGTQGTGLTFFNAGTNASIKYDGTDFLFSRGIESQATSINSGGYLRLIVGDVNSSEGVEVALKSCNGTSASPTIVLNNDNLSNIYTSGHDGSIFDVSTRIASFVDGVASAGSIPGRITFSTTPATGNGTIERMWIKANGRVGIANSDPSYPLDVTGTARTSSVHILGAQANSGGHAVRADRTVTAGVGLTGGGDLTDNVVINVHVIVIGKLDLPAGIGRIQRYIS